MRLSAVSAISQFAQTIVPSPVSNLAMKSGYPERVIVGSGRFRQESP